MPLLVVGSIALDTVETPHGKVKEVLGGSAVYFSWAAQFFSPVRLVGVVGKDFPKELKELISIEKIDASGVVEMEGKTFRWSGSYHGAMNAARTLSVELNVLGEFRPQIPHHFRDSKFVFLANGVPVMQKSILEQVSKPKFVAADTMNHWIENEKKELLDLLKRIDAIVLNDEEARLLTGEVNLLKAGRIIQGWGPKYVIIKKGEHGAILIKPEGFFLVPAYPTEEVKDPTGAGDSFAGGMMGYLASSGEANSESIGRAMVYGTVLASFNVEDFSVNRFRQITLADIKSRLRKFESMVTF